MQQQDVGLLQFFELHAVVDFKLLLGSGFFYRCYRANDARRFNRAIDWTEVNAKRDANRITNGAQGLRCGN